MNPNSGRKKWVITIVIAAVLIAAAVAVAIFAGQGPDDPVVDTPKESPIGLYYYDTAEGEYLLTLSEGNVFMISGPSLNKSGKCVVTDNGIKLDFVKDEDGTGSLKEENGVMTLQYKDKTMRFLEKKTFKVNFNVNGGSEVAAINVVNGKTVAKPADPKKDGSVFIGWYADEACTKLYGFGNEVITADTTVYAKWAETVVGQNEYTVNFDLGYDAEGFAAMSTIGGKLYNVPAPTRDGYTFAGWWVSQTQNADELTIPYVEDMVFQANTTLFALWTTTPTGGKLAAPMVEVYADSIKWNTIQGANTYLLKILDAENNVIHEEKLGANAKNFDFATRAAGEYTVEVTALASVEDKNSETTTRTFVNKALERVSLFTVIDGGILLWNGVEGAEKYLITIDCGNDAHKHTAFDNGDSTTFMFSNCSMQAGGIKFTVTAVADGMASSVSETFVYDRKLDAVGEILYNEDTQSFYWDSVANAAKYSITVKVGGKTFTVDNGSATTFSAKYLSGDITLEIIPVTQGYNSPEATTTTYKKTSLATPEGLTVNGTTLSWNAVEGATGYMVKVNNQSFQAETNALDLTTTTLSLDSSTTYDICVMAVGTESSLYSDVVTMKYLADIENVIYKNNTVTWTPVMGVENYEIRVNGEVVETVSGKNFAQIKLSKAGVNVIEVRYTDLGGSKWIGTEVFAYEVIYDSRSLSGVEKEYLAIGDTMKLPETFTQDGYDFTGWYNAPDAANGLGGIYTETQFNYSGAIILYANWTPKTYQIEFVGMTGVTNIAEGDKQAVTYKDGFKLPIPEAGDEMGEFMGWYTGPGGSGVVLTDAKGNSLTSYAYTRDAVVYPAFNNGVLTYILQEDGTYAVTAGPNIKGATTITVPEYYKNIAVTTILENAFNGIATIEKIVIPATIKTIGVGAIPNTKAMQAITVYTDTIQQNYEVFYSSHDGALLRHDMGSVYLENFPRGKTGEYTVPDHVDVIRDNVFRYSQITKLIVGNGVQTVSRRAFYRCENLEVLEFKGEGTNALTIDPEAFYNTKNIAVLRLPGRLARMDLQVLNQFTKLTTLEVEAGGTNYSSIDNSIYNATGSAILFAAMSLSGEYEIPLGVQEIGPMAFNGRTGLTKIIVPSHVSEIGDSAFMNSTGITEVLIEGNRNKNLTIGQKAFFGCERIAAVTFQGNGTANADKGATIIGISAFEGLKLLSTVVFESGVNIVQIGDRAFADNSKLHTLTYSDGAFIGAIGAQAYAGCTQLDEAVIPATTTSVGDGAFSGCEGLRAVTFAPNGQQVTFGSNVFENCSRLTTVNLPATLGYFDGSVFAGCDSITEIVVDPANQSFVTYGGALYSMGYEELIFYPRNLDGDMSKLHADLKKIGNNVFQGNPKITKAVIGKNVVAIGDYAFESCAQLAEVVFEEGSTAMTIGNSAFAKCTKLTAIALPACTTTIGVSAFESSALKSFVIPESTTSLGEKALKSTKITEINIPANLTTIGDGAFARCSSLVTVTFAEGSQPLTIGTLENTDTTNGVFYGTKIKVFEVGDRVTMIGAYAFYSQTSLTTVTMSENSQVTEIGQFAFGCKSNTSKLTSLTLGPKVEVINASAFYYAKLTSITIPKSVTTIGTMAFRWSRATEIYFEPGGTEPLTFEGEYIFSNNSYLTKITLPARLITAYEVVTWNGTQVKNFVTHFAVDPKLETIEMEEGSELFTVVDSVVYEKNENDEVDTLLFCAPAKTGDFMVPAEIRKVENGAFYFTKLSTISFEEYPEDHENYGKPLLSLGDGHSDNLLGGYDVLYAVISMETTGKGVNVKTVGNLTNVKLPSHLKKLGIFAFSGIALDGITITFNMDAHLEAIENNAISSSFITEINLPAVDYIASGVFADDGKLTKVTFHPDSKFTSLDQAVFRNCIALTSIEIPASVTTIGNRAFDSCKTLSNITFAPGSQLKEIGEYAFQYAAMEALVLPDLVSAIGNGAFNYCDNLKTVTISKSLATLITTSGTSMFNCVNLEKILVPADNPYLKSIDGVVYDTAETILYCFPQGKDPSGFTLPETLITIENYALYSFKGTSLVLPESLETIGSNAFTYSNLTSIHIPRNVKTIGTYAFRGSNTTGHSLETLTFAPDSKLESIGNYCFYDNGKLLKVELPDNLAVLGNNAFYGCLKLEEVALSAALKEIATGVLGKCPSLKNVVLQEGIERILGSAFSGASAHNVAMTELTIPSTVTEIMNHAFSYLTALKKITFAEGSRLETLGVYVFQECTSLESVTLPASLKNINTEDSSYRVGNASYKSKISGMFRNCVNLKHLDMSACSSITVIPSKFMENCTSLETLLLPATLETINDFAFGDSQGKIGDPTQPLCSLKQITIPATVTDLGAYTFYGCESLESVTFETGSALTKLGDDVAPNDRPLWGQSLFYGTTAMKTVILPENLTAIGPSCFENSGVENIEIPDSVSIICTAGFKNCDNLTEVELPNELVHLGDEAFFDCDKLEKADLTFGLEYLGSLAFGFCEQLKRAYIPATITAMAGNPYTGCTGVQTLELDPDSVDYVLEEGILYDKTMYTLVYYPASLTAESFEFPETVQEIAPGAFAGAQLKNMILPSRIKVIPDSAFRNSALENIVFHAGVTSIGDHAFDGCQKLNNVTVLSNIKNLGDYAFANCTGLTSFTFEEIPDGADSYVIGQHFFDGCTGITEVILPNRMSITDAEVNSLTSVKKDTAIPSYMFANTGIVHAVIPAQITDPSTLGVFYGCKNMETFVFEAEKLNGRCIGSEFFYGCSKLKEVIIPAGLSYPLDSNRGSSIPAYTFGECTALEKIVIYTTSFVGIETRHFNFYNCTSLHTLEVYRDNNGTITDSGFQHFYENAFYGCINLKQIPLATGSIYFYGSSFTGSGIETLNFQNSSFYIYDGIPFAGMKNLKQIFFGCNRYFGLNKDTFTNVESEVSIYFYKHTKEEIVKQIGNDEWFSNADKKVTFYFKDTMPEGVEVPA